MFFVCAYVCIRCTTQNTRGGVRCMYCIYYIYYIVQVILFTLQIIYRFAICFCARFAIQCVFYVYILNEFRICTIIQTPNIDEFRLFVRWFVCLLVCLFVCLHTCMNACILARHPLVHFNCLQKYLPFF